MVFSWGSRGHGVSLEKHILGELKPLEHAWVFAFDVTAEWESSNCPLGIYVSNHVGVAAYQYLRMVILEYDLDDFVTQSEE